MLKKLKKILLSVVAKPIAQPPQTAEETLPGSEELLYQQYRSVATDKISLGRDGNLKLHPKSIWLYISDNCNLKCIGCYTEGKFEKSYADVEQVRKAIQFSGKIEEISFTTNEALLHPQFCDIIDMCREMHPEAQLWVITNGTIPIKGRYRQAIAKLDKVGLSIDGATRETFETIRVGARFDAFIENAKEIIRIRKETGWPKEISFCFTATATNLHELIDVVRLAHSIGVPDVWAHPMETRADEIITARISDILLDRLDPALRQRLLDDARAEASNLGIGFYTAEGIYPAQAPLGEDQATEAERRKLKEWHVKLCQYPWAHPVQISRFGDQYVVRPCCYIKPTKRKLLAEKYGLIYPEIKSGEEIYNSPQLWQFREDLLNGKTSDVCGACDAARDYQWQPAPTADPKL